MQIGRKKSNEFELDTKVIKICFWTKFELVHESWKFRKMIIAYQFLHLLPQHLIIEICESNNNTNFWKLFSLPNKFPLGWWFQWYIIHAYSLQEKGLFEVKTDQNRTNLAKKSKKLLTLMLIVEVITDRIIWFLKILRIPNTELFSFWKWTNTEYQIVLFGLNYSNTEFLKSNSSPPKKFICEFCD